MTHDQLHSALLDNGFTRIERDDRLLDLFPQESLEKGVELWEKWDKDVVRLVRIRLPFSEKKIKTYQIPRTILEKALLENSQLKLIQDWEVALKLDF